MSGTAVDPREREYLSPYSTNGFGLSLIQLGVPTDADAGVAVTLIAETDASVVFSQAADNPAVGQYLVPTTPAQTAVPGFYTVVWNYALGGVAQEYRTYLEIGQPNPAFDMLTDPMKDIVETTWIRFADEFDSPGGGPNVQTYFQTHYGRGRLAELMKIAVGTLNTVSQPHQTFTLDGVGGATFPIAQWGPLLERSLYIEVLKHLIRSYVEQPNVIVGENVTRLDRRDYMDRWRSVLQDEQQTFKSELETFKIANMGLGKVAVLVAGGSYGKYGPTRLAGSVAARPRIFARWY